VLTIDQNSEVTLHFSLSLHSGETIDSSFEGPPGTFCIGDETLPQGFEKLLFGLRAGDRRSFLTAPEQGFGSWRQENMQRFRAEDLENRIEGTLSVGLTIVFKDASGQHVSGVIKDVPDDLTNNPLIDVDFNHPLAGRPLIFAVEIVAVQAKAQAVTFLS